MTPIRVGTARLPGARNADIASDRSRHEPAASHGRMRRHAAALARATTFLVAFAMMLLALSAPARAALTSSWTTGASSASSTVSDLTVTHSGVPGNGSYATDTMPSSSSWWTNPYGGTVSGSTGLYGWYVPGSGTLKITVNFSLPVTNPVLHVGEIGATYGGTNTSVVWALGGSVSQGGNVVMERLSGNSLFLLDESSIPGFRRSIGGTQRTSNACTTNSTGQACGSIRFNGTGITQLSFNLTMRNYAGSGDSLLLQWSFRDEDVTRAPSPSLSGRVFVDNGVGGGTANDGILNGAETPQAGIAMRLTDCANAVYATTLTDGTGSYNFPVPTSVASGSTLCVRQTNSGRRLSTGASVGSTALPPDTATAAAGGSYTYRPDIDAISFTWDLQGRANLNFGDVDNSSFAAGSAKSAAPGNTVTHAHTFTAATAGRVRFSIAGESAAPPVDGWSAQLFSDPGCTASLQPGAVQLYPSAGAGAAVAAGEKVCVVVRQFVPATAPPGAKGTVAVQADFDYANASPALSASFGLDDVTTVSSGALALTKEVRNVTQNAGFGVNNQARPGETLEFRISYANNGSGPISSLKINDFTPAYSSFVSADVDATPSSLTGCSKRTPANASPAPTVDCAAAQGAGGTGAIEWAFAGALDPGAAGAVLFRVKVD